MELDLEEDNKGLIQKVLKYLVPFRVLVGIIMLVISGGILGSLALSSIDRVNPLMSILIAHNFLHLVD